MIDKTIIVIPSINGKTLLERFLPTIDIPKSCVLVVDQGSKDGTEDFCKENGVHCLQLRSRATFTEACNAGIEWAIAHGAEYICLANNDIEFTTPVIHQLLKVIQSDMNIGAIAPTQVIKNRTGGEAGLIVYRTKWNLAGPNFDHDFDPYADSKAVRESNFCEFTCVVIPSHVIKKIGLLDNQYGFYYEDADFCFRLRLAGFRTVYHQGAQIVHYASSTFDRDAAERKNYFVSKNRQLFTNKYMGYGFNYPRLESNIASSWTVVNEFLYKHLNQFGLINQFGKKLAFGHPGDVDSDYLYTAWETSQLPESWLLAVQKYKCVFLPSQWNYDVFQKAGIKNIAYVPLGVDTDVFVPAGEKVDFGYGFVCLSVMRNQYRKALDVTLEAWAAVRENIPDSQLVVFGYDIVLLDSLNPDEVRWYGKLKFEKYSALKVTVVTPIEPLTSTEMAAIYRGANVLLMNSRSEGFGFPVVEAMACGKRAIFPSYGATKDFCFPGALTITGVEVIADYSDKGYGNVGTWWEPNSTDIQSRILEAYNMPIEVQHDLEKRGRNFVCSQFTWQKTVIELYKILVAEGDTVEKIEQPEKIPEKIKHAFMGNKNFSASVGHLLTRISQKISKAGEHCAYYGIRATFIKSCKVILRKIF